VFYKNVQAAEADAYPHLDPDHFSEKGYVHAFSGIRSDAKQLYKRIMKGQERRIELVKADSFSVQQEYISKADLVIWACGYQSSGIPILDVDGTVISLS